MALGFLLVLGVCAGATRSDVSAADAFDDNQVPIENRPENGSLHIYADDSLEEEVVDPPSMLLSSDGSSFCGSADTGACAGRSGLSYVAHLPACGVSVTTDCVVGITAQTTSGAESSGSFDRYFPDQGPQSFTGKPSIQLPSGRAPGVWSIPGAPHLAGTQYAVVARLRGSTSSRKAASFQVVVTPVSLKTDADTRDTYEMPRWLSLGRLSGPAADRGLFRCAYWGENGSCLLSHAFPSDTRFTVTVRLAVEPSGWLHGRINDPSITFTKDGTDTVMRISALPTQVPAFQVGRQYSDFPADVQAAFAYNGPYGAGGSRQPGGQYRTDPAQRNAEYNIQAWKNDSFAQLALMKNVIADRAGWAPWLWRVRTLSNAELASGGSCLTTGDGLKGIVTTNATVYGSGPPSYNSSTSTLTYRVAAPHFTRTGEVFQGTYDLQMRTDVARCLYNLDSDLVAVNVTVVAENGSLEPVSTKVVQENGWLKISVSGFTHSAPTIKVSIIQSDDTANQTKAIYLALATSKKPVVRTKTKRSISATTLLVVSRIDTPKSARVSMVVIPQNSATCKVKAGKVRTLRPGKCTVKVIVRAPSRKTQTATVTLKVT